MNTITDNVATYNEQLLNELFHVGDSSDDCQSARTQDYYDRQPQSFEGLSRANVRHIHMLKKYIENECSKQVRKDLEEDLEILDNYLDCPEVWHRASATISTHLKMLPNDLVIEMLEEEFDELGVESFYEEYGISHPDNFA